MVGETIEVALAIELPQMDGAALRLECIRIIDGSNQCSTGVRCENGTRIPGSKVFTQAPGADDEMPGRDSCQAR